MIVCVCNRVSDREIARHVEQGLDFSDIQLELGVATQCGQCESCARELVERCCGATAQAPALGDPRVTPIFIQRPAWPLSSASA